MEKILINDREALLKQLQEQKAQNARHQLTIVKLTEQIESLQHKLDKFFNMMYGVKSEKKPKVKAEPQFTVSDVVQGTKEQKQSVVISNNANGRRSIPPDFPRVRVEHDVPEGQRGCRCCSNKMQRMGKVITEQLEYKPGEFYVIEHVRLKYACQRCKQDIVTAELPRQPIDKGLPGPGLLTEVILNKYQDHLPLYRQEKRFLRSGIDLPRSTLCDWVMQSAMLLEPIVKRMRTDSVLKGPRVFTDDTTVPVLAKDKTHTGRLWVYIGGGRENPNAIVYEYTRSRSQIAPKNFLKGFKGYCQADAYSGYNVLYQSGEIIEVGCWAHARRKFSEIAKITKKSGLADTAIDIIGQLYDIEQRGKFLTSLQKKYLRRKYSKPILRKFHRWLKIEHQKALPKTPIGKAISYALNHWQALNNYLRDGILNIDNNTAERAIKTVVIGRKNWLFAGSHEGAEKAAVLYSLIETCKLHGINPFLYFQNVLKRLPNTLMKNIDELLPYNWKLTA